MPAWQWTNEPRTRLMPRAERSPVASSRAAAPAPRPAVASLPRVVTSMGRMEGQGGQEGPLN